jgi:streptogramin lyase
VSSAFLLKIVKNMLVRRVEMKIILSVIIGITVLGLIGFSQDVLAQDFETSIPNSTPVYNLKQDFAVSPDGSIYVADTVNHRIIVVNPDGTPNSIIGEFGTGPGQFNDVGAISVDSSGKVFAVGLRNHRINIFNPDGTFHSSLIGEDTIGRIFQNLFGVYVDANDVLYVLTANDIAIFNPDLSFNSLVDLILPPEDAGKVNFTNFFVDDAGYFYGFKEGFDKRVFIFNPDGTFNSILPNIDDIQIDDMSSDSSGKFYILASPNVIRILNSDYSFSSDILSGEFNFPLRIALDSFDNLFVQDWFSIQKFDSSFAPLLHIGTFGRDSDILFNGPTDVFVNSDNEILVADRFNHKIKRFNSDGSLISVFGDKFTTNSVRKVLETPSGDILMYAGGSIKKFNTDGTFISDLQDKDVNCQSAHPALLCVPEDMSIGPDEKLYVAISKHGFQGVAIFNPDGTLDSNLGDGKIRPLRLVNPSDVGIGPNDKLYVTDTGTNEIFIFNPDGTLDSKFSPLNSTINSIDVDTNGLIYTIDSLNQRIQIFNPDGTLSTSFGSECNLRLASDPNCIDPDGEEGPLELGDGQFRHPQDLVIKNNKIFVVDFNRRIQIFELDGTFVSKFGGSSPSEGSLVAPRGLAIGPSDKIYVVEPVRPVKVFNPDGAFAFEFGGPCNITECPFGVPDDLFNNVQNISIDSNGLIYLADSFRIKVFNPDGTFNFAFGQSGTDDGQLAANPGGLSFSSNSQLVIADTGNDRIQIFNPDGTFHSSIGTERDPYVFGEPRSVFVDSVGKIHVLDAADNSISVFDQNGDFEFRFGQTGSEDGQFETPLDVSADSFGWIYVADTFNHRIQIFNPDGTFYSKFGSAGYLFGQFHSPSSVALDSSGKIYVSDQGNHRIQIFSALDDPIVDSDDDGFLPPEDCDDSDAAVNPGATEVCDGSDNNCDGNIDEGGDLLCDNGLFCDGAEICVGINGCQPDIAPSTDDGVSCTDDSCDEATDSIVNAPNDAHCDDGSICTAEFCDGSISCSYTNLDLGEITCGVGQCQNTVSICVDGVEQTCIPLPATDEVCDGLDNDCDGSIDEELGQTTCGLGVCEHAIDNCVAGVPQACDPLEGATDETCDGLDNDCDGTVDEELTFDVDGDGHSTPSSCDGTRDDCDDSDAAVNPDATEVCDDGIDNDCNGDTDAADNVCINVPTNPGNGIIVEPIDPVTGNTPATIEFDQVTGEGTSSVTTSGTGTPPPQGFKLGSPPVYYEVTTTSSYNGYVTVCINYDETEHKNEDKLALKHRWDIEKCQGKPNGLDPNFDYTQTGWETVTDAGYPDTLNNIICGTVTCLSPFITVEPFSITAPVDPVAVNTEITASAPYNNEHVAIWDWDDGATSEGVVSADGNSWEGSHTYNNAGIYTVSLTVNDSNNGVIGSTKFQYIVVYDSSGGFVTGGGWIDSPRGAYRPDPLLVGKANFGFVSKYKKGATVPTGETEFQFSVADLNFHSDTYEWLVIAGAQAQYKGEGTINGEDPPECISEAESECTYKFILWGIDADMNDNDSFETDKFKIRIWWEEQINDEVTEHVVYDNALGDDSDGAMTEIGGGSIVIHKGKK